MRAINNYEMSASDYELLYRRFLKRGPEQLFQYAKYCDHMEVLDLCAGPTARASIWALQHNARRVVAVDESPRILNEFPYTEKQGFDAQYIDIRTYLRFAVAKSQRFDIILCQQGINYWFNQDDLLRVSYLLKGNGVFVFNTFNDAPDENVPLIKEYHLDNNDYKEVSLLLGRTIMHAQIVKDVIQHFTNFMWILPDEIFSVLYRCFKRVERIRDGHTDIYICMN